MGKATAIVCRRVKTKHHEGVHYMMDRHLLLVMSVLCSPRHCFLSHHTTHAWQGRIVAGDWGFLTPVQPRALQINSIFVSFLRTQTSPFYPAT